MSSQFDRMDSTSEKGRSRIDRHVPKLLKAALLAGWIFIYTACTPISPSHAEKNADLPVSVQTPVTTAEPVVLPSPTRTTEEPLHFSFPTPYSPPVSLWRPPQYDVPFALSPFDHFFFSRPIGSEDINWPLADYRYGGIFFSTDIIHTGIDLPNPRGTPVLAAASGEVIWAGNGLYTNDPEADDPYGLAVVIEHDFGYRGRSLNTVYAHMDGVYVTVGQQVNSGEQIGIVGMTGATTGPHLHFEVRLETNNFYSTRNPELWLVPPEGWGVLAGRVMNGDGDLLRSYEVSVYSLDSNEDWVVYTYGGKPANSDEYYQENMVLSDLPQGNYKIVIEYDEETYRHQVTIGPGRITYFTFRGPDGYSDELPPPITP